MMGRYQMQDQITRKARQVLRFSLYQRSELVTIAFQQAQIASALVFA